MLYVRTTWSKQGCFFLNAICVVCFKYMFQAVEAAMMCLCSKYLVLGPGYCTKHQLQRIVTFDLLYNFHSSLATLSCSPCLWVVTSMNPRKKHVFGRWGSITVVQQRISTLTPSAGRPARRHESVGIGTCPDFLMKNIGNTERKQPIWPIWTRRIPQQLYLLACMKRRVNFLDR